MKKLKKVLKAYESPQTVMFELYSHETILSESSVGSESIDSLGTEDDSDNWY